MTEGNAPSAPRDASSVGGPPVRQAASDPGARAASKRENSDCPRRASVYSPSRTAAVSMALKNGVRGSRGGLRRRASDGLQFGAVAPMPEGSNTSSIADPLAGLAAHSDLVGQAHRGRRDASCPAAEVFEEADPVGERKALVPHQ